MTAIASAARSPSFDDERGAAWEAYTVTGTHVLVHDGMHESGARVIQGCGLYAQVMREADVTAAFIMELLAEVHVLVGTDYWENRERVTEERRDPPPKVMPKLTLRPVSSSRQQSIHAGQAIAKALVQAGYKIKVDTGGDGIKRSMLLEESQSSDTGETDWLPHCGAYIEQAHGRTDFEVVCVRIAQEEGIAIDKDGRGRKRTFREARKTLEGLTA